MKVKLYQKCCICFKPLKGKIIKDTLHSFETSWGIVSFWTYICSECNKKRRKGRVALARKKPNGGGKE
jgi:hypothetical protein